MPPYVALFLTDEFLNIYISVKNQTDFFCQLIERYLNSVSVSAYVCFYTMAGA